MKRSETNSSREDAGRSALVRACARWLSFARTLSRGPRRRTALADTLAFIESLYGGRFTNVEGGACSLDKVYRTAGGGLFVSETHLSVSMHPRFDLRLLNVAGGRAGAQVFREATTATLTLLSHSGASGRGQSRAARHGTNNVVATPLLTAQTWSVLPAGAERVPPAFGYVSIRGERAQPAQGPESARGHVATGTSAETASLRLASLDLRRPVVDAPRQEFVSVLLNRHLPAVESREILSVLTTGNLSFARPGRATAQGATERRFAPGSSELQRPAWTSAETSPRHAPGGAVEIRREFRSDLSVREHAPTRDPRPPLLHVLSPASLLLSLSETSLTLLAGGAGSAGQTTYPLSGRVPALSLQHLRTHTTPSGTREGSAAVRAPRLFEQTPRQPTGTREVLSSLHTFIERVHSTFAGDTHAGSSTGFTRPGFASALRRGFEQVPARHSGASREASTHEASTRTAPDRAPGLFSTQAAPGAGTFLFAAGLLRRTTEAATELRETAGAPSEARAARPEGMALELIRHRREEVLRLPSPGYVFTQPARAQLEERQVITKASREEIVEVVRKEVRALGTTAPAPLAASRADLAGLADEVYSTLVRRLLVEKERLGRL